MPWPPRRDSSDATVPHQDDTGEQLSLIRLINLLLKRRRVIFLTTALAFVTTVVATLFTARSYSSSVSFVPQERAQSIADLTGFLPPQGFLLPRMSSQSSAFYADLLSSDELMRAAVVTNYEVRDESDGTIDTQLVASSLIEHFEIEMDDPEASTERAVERLRDKTTVHNDRETGVVRYSVTTRSPNLSRQIAERLFDLVSEFDLDRRQSQASAEGQFIAARMDSARTELRSSENRLENFLARNRNFTNSPALVFQRDRLQRDVSFNQQILGSLAEAFERARIEEVRNTPVLTVVDHARARRLPDSRRLPLKAVIAILAGITIGIGATLWLEFMARSRVVEPDAYDEFVSLKRDTLSSVRGLFPRRGDKKE